MNKKIKLFLFIFVVISGFIFAGAEWTVKTVTTSTKKHGDNSTIIAKVYTDGINVRQEFVKIESKGRDQNPYEGQDIYWLYKGKEDVVYIVNKNDKTYMALPIDAMLQLSKMVGKIVKFEIEDYNIKKTELAPQVINGFKCKHVKLLITYKMKMKIAFIKKTMKIEEEKEIWGSKDFKYFNNFESAFVKRNYKTGFEELDEAIAKEIGMYKDLGFPIKTVRTSIERDKKNKIKGKTVTTTEIMDVKEKNFSKSFFEIPQDYQREERNGGSPF